MRAPTPESTRPPGVITITMGEREAELPPNKTDERERAKSKCTICHGSRHYPSNMEMMLCDLLRILVWVSINRTKANRTKNRMKLGESHV